MNAETAQCDQPTIKKKCGKDDAFMANEYLSMDDECSDRGENSDDLFSDCEERKDTTYYSPNVSHATNSTLSNLSASSLLHSNHQYGTPAAVVPSTPLSLLPFLSKVSEQWTSDLETPQADRTVGPYINQSTTSMGSSEKGINQKQCTPPLLNMNNKETHCITASPVITCKKKRNRTKRRIFRSAIVSPSGTTLPNVVECAKQTEPQTEVPMEQIECENIKEKFIPHLQKMVVCKDNVVNARINTCLSRNSVPKISNTSPIVNNHNTSTQDFFTNASFTDVDKLCENNLTEGNPNIIQACEKINSKNCEAGQQKTVPSAKYKNNGKQSEVENILNKVNECKRLVEDYMVDGRDKSIKINIKNEAGKHQNDHTLVKAIDIHFNSSIDTQDWFINESALHETKDLFAIKSESTDDAKIHILKEDKDDQQQKRFIQNEVICDNIVNSDCTKKQRNVTLSSKRLTCAESDFDHFLKKLDRNEYEKPFLGFTAEEKSTAETKSLAADKLIGNFETNGLIKQAINNETCMIQNDNSSSLSTASGKGALLWNKTVTNPKILNKNQLLDNSKEAGLFVQPQAKKNNHAKDNNSSGFSTASGKSIALSENALLTAKTLFADELLDDPKGSNVPQQLESTKELAQSFHGSYFSTASGKSIKLSDEALTKANAFLADECTSEVEIPQSCLEPKKLMQYEQKTDNSCYFSTANGKPLALSDKALSKAMALVADDTLNYNEDLEMPVQSNKDLKVNTSNFHNFTTAKGQPMTISQEALSKAKALFAVELEETTTEIQFGNKLLNSNGKFEFSVQKPTDKLHVMKDNDTCGFSTASGKSIALSDKALSKANALFAEDTLDNNKDFEMFAQSFKKQKMNQKNSLKFTTAKDHPMKEEQKGSSRVINLYAEKHEKTAPQTLCVNKCKGNNEGSEFSVQKPMSKPNMMKTEDSYGFSTASGKSIALSEKALSKANALFAEDTLDNNKDFEMFAQSFKKHKMNQKNSLNFTAAKDRPMKEEQKGSSRVINLYVDEHEKTASQTLCANKFKGNNEGSEFSVQKPMSKPNMMKIEDSCGFSTASGKSIALSEKALSKANALFAEDTLDNNKDFEMFAQSFKKQKMNQKNSLNFTAAKDHPMKEEQKGSSRVINLYVDEHETTASQTLCANKFKGNNEGSEFSVQKPMSKPNMIRIEDSCGFSTASGKSIALSEKALSKANALFAEDTLDNNKDFEMFAQSFKKQKMNQKNSLNFTAAKDHPMKEEQKGSSRVINLYVDEHEKTASQTLCANKFKGNNEGAEFSVQKSMSKPNMMKIDDSCGFSTASGKSIALSEKALSEAKTLFADDSVGNDEDLELFAQSFKKQKMNKIYAPKVTTARDHAMTIYEKALSKAKCIFANDLKQTTGQTPFLNDLSNSYERCESSIKKPIDKPNVMKNDGTCGFSTASGKSIALSDNALSKAKSLFADDFLNDNENSETLIQLEGELIGKQNNLPEDNQFYIVGDGAKENKRSILFSTASGKPVNVSEKAIQKAQELLLNDVDDTSEKQSSAKNILGEKLSNISNSVFPNNTGIKPILLNNTPSNSEFQFVQKRKISNSDDDTPLGRHAMSTFKKPRFSDDRQGRKLVFDDVNSDKEINKQSSQSVDTNFGCEPLQVFDEQNTKKYKVARSLSDEIAASASALLADETDENNFKNHTAQEKDKATEKSPVTLSCSTSPVLGRPAFPQRRSKRKTIGCASTNVPDVEQNIVTGKKKVRLSDSAFCTKIPQSDGATKTLGNRADLDSVKTNDFVDTQFIMDYIDKTTDISEKRLAAALEQDKIIQAKKRNKPKRTMSTLLLYKETNKNKRISWRKLTNGDAPILYSYKEANKRNMSPEILNMTTNSATTYRFRCSDFYGDNVIETNVNGLEMVDGARLILDENGYVGLPEISRAFLASPGVDPALLPVGWIKNHYCWIVWKLASMDRVKFTSVSLPRALTPARVMEQMKYRYDREIDKSQRPALRRILEKDDAGSKRMILCVSSLVECKNADVVGKSPSIAIASSWKMVLTDGWYSVPACIDLAMINNIISGKVRKGTKLLICGAELLNSDQGCSPLEIPGDICLKIHTNSTRRAKWYAKMGFSPCPGPIPVKLQSVCPHGGLIGKMVITIVRVYPLLYHEKTTTGESVFRNARCEEKANLAYEQECRSKMEALYAKTEKYFSNGKKSLCTNTDTDSMDFLAAELSEQCQNLSEEEFMSKQQQESLLNKCRMKEEEFKQKLESKLWENLPPQRKVSPVLKLRVADEKKCAILTVWSPSDDVMDTLKEGNRVLMCGVSASGKRADELQLTAGRNTVFKLESKNAVSYPNRICTPLCSIADPAFNPTYGEVDTVGLIVSIQNGPYGMKNFEAVNLTYQRKNSSEYSYLSILFWQSIATYGYKEILTVGSFVACSNLEWRRATTASIPLVYCTERTTFTRNPRQAYLQSAIDELKASIAEPDVCIAYCTDEISAELQKKLIAKSPGYITPNKLLPTIAPQKSTGHNLGPTNSSIVNPRSSSVQKRLEKLKWYGEPSELPPIIVNTRSTRISLDFRSPVANRKVTPTRPP